MGTATTLGITLSPIWGNKQVSQITSIDVQKLYTRLKREGRVHEHPEFGYQLSDAMVNRIHAMFHRAMKIAEQEHLISKNPTEGVAVPKPNYRPKQILNDKQLDKFMEAIRQDEVWRDFFYTELTIGLRCGELCGLRWEDFDEEAGTLKVCRTLHSKKMGVFALRDTKTSKGTCTIILPQTEYRGAAAAEEEASCQPMALSAIRRWPYMQEVNRERK